MRGRTGGVSLDASEGRPCKMKVAAAAAVRSDGHIFVLTQQELERGLRKVGFDIRTYHTRACYRTDNTTVVNLTIEVS